MIDDVKAAGTKAGIALFGGALSALTLNEWVAIATLVYIGLQVLHLIWKWFGEIKHGHKS